MISAGRIRVADEGATAIVPSSCLTGLAATLPRVRSWRNTSNNKNAIKKLNEAPINTRQENGKNGAREKSRKREREREKKRCAKRAEQREAEEGTVNLLCISSTGSTKTSYRERYRGTILRK